MSPVPSGVAEPAQRLRFGDFEIDTGAARLRRQGEVVRVEPRILKLLLFLLDNRQRIVTKEELNQAVWGGAFVTDNAVDRAVARLRKTLGDDVREPRYIETVPREGYRFVAEVESAIAEPEASPTEAPVHAAPAAAGAPRPRRFSPLGLIAMGAPLVAALVLVVASRTRDTPVERLDPATAPERIVARQLTSSPAYEFAPSFSPDGASLAYTSNRSGNTALWVRSLAPGGGERELTETAGAGVAAWSPDGRWIAYDSYQGIWIVPPTGGSPRQLVERGGNPRWSPDGSMVVFQEAVEGIDINSWVTRPPSTLWTVGLDGGPPRQLTQPDQPAGGHGHPTFSRDGRQIAFLAAEFGQAGDLWTMDAAGGDLRLVLAGCQCRDPVFSGDGELLYYADYVDSQYALWEVSAAGGSPPRRIYEAPLRFLSLSADGSRLAASRHELQSDLWSVAVEPATGAPSGAPQPLTQETVYRTQFPVASPTGDRIAFIATRAGNVRELWTMGDDGSDLQLLASGAMYGWPAWSPDSRQVYFVDGPEVRRVDIATRRLVTVVRTDLPWQTPAVAPGGGAVAFALADPKGVQNIWTLDASNGAIQVTHDSEGVSFPTWSPDARFLAVEVKRRGLRLGYVAIESGEVVVLTEPGQQCFTGGWSPGGERIAMACRPNATPFEHWNIWWVSRTTGRAQRLTDRPLHPAREFVRYPSWSVAGDRVWFELAQSSADIWVLDLRASSD